MLNPFIDLCVDIYIEIMVYFGGEGYKMRAAITVREEEQTRMVALNALSGESVFMWCPLIC